MIAVWLKHIKFFPSLILFGLAFPLVFSLAQAHPVQTQTITFINVAEGDSALLADGNGYYVLIDGGKPEQGPRVDQYLHSQGITELNVIMASHADSDHIGGLITVLGDTQIKVDQVLYNGYPGTTAAWNDFISAVSARGLLPAAAHFPQELTWGNMNAHILNPALGLDNPDSNDASLVVRVDYGSVDTLFTGDISSVIESTVVARGTPVAAEVLKVAHHGSSGSSSPAFLAAVLPQVAVISVGPNSYGHPADQTLSRLSAEGSTIWRTDRYGNIQVSTSGDAVSVSPQNPFLYIYLPLFQGSPLQNTATPTPTSTPEGANNRCSQVNAAQICGWVSDGSPAQGAKVTVYGRLLVNGAPQAGQTLTATWKFKSTTSECTAITDASGLGSCERLIGNASLGYQVDLTVAIANYSVTTWFIPK